MTAAAPARWLLPAEAYWSADWYEAERDRIFGRCWNLVGTEDDLAGGRTLVADIAGATVAIDGSGPTLAGRQKSGPAAVDVWAGYLFVHLDPVPATSLAEWLGDFPALIGDFHPERLVEVARHRFELAANWKLFVENHIDVYHLWYLHQDSLGLYDHPRAAWSMCGPHWVFYEPPRTDVDTHDERFWRGLVPIGHLGEQRWGSGAHLIWPNVTLATGAGFFMTYQCVPLRAERCLIDLRVRAEPGGDPAVLLAMSKGVIQEEDGSACENMQAAVRSPWFSVGPLACDHERPITMFHEHVLGAMRRP